MSHIVMILDESGSMDSLQEAIIKSVNEFITKQKKLKDECTFTFITFSDVVKTNLTKVPMALAPTLTTDNYKPTGCTALFKAITDTIKVFENDSNVIMVIVTDGQENASGPEYTRQSVFDLVSKHKNKNGWTFVYLNTDIDTFTQGDNIGFGTTGFTTSDTGPTCNTTGCNNVAIGYNALAKGISKDCCQVVSNARHMNVHIGFTV
ncbi:MAG TPA: vWA domain-containing protein [Candidatus Saccharimonadales bacterium]|nr:vWA domain-containing protein [Candidatus Saccharimonadales bacterium]